jgi:hypothetical protein
LVGAGVAAAVVTVGNGLTDTVGTASGGCAPACDIDSAPITPMPSAPRPSSPHTPMRIHFATAMTFATYLC